MEILRGKSAVGDHRHAAAVGAAALLAGGGGPFFENVAAGAVELYSPGTRAGGCEGAGGQKTGNARSSRSATGRGTGERLRIGRLIGKRILRRADTVGVV